MKYQKEKGEERKQRKLYDSKLNISWILILDKQDRIIKFVEQNARKNRKKQVRKTYCYILILMEVIKKKKS